MSVACGDDAKPRALLADAGGSGGIECEAGSDDEDWQELTALSDCERGRRRRSKASSAEHVDDSMETVPVALDFDGTGEVKRLGVVVGRVYRPLESDAAIHIVCAKHQACSRWLN